MKIITIVGARPQFIKAATVSRALAALTGVTELLIHTGQHYDENMSDVFFSELMIPKPTYHLGLGTGSHGQMTGRMLEGLETVLLKEKPDWVLVYGDTNSTLAGALAAAKLHIPIAHVEAGLRSFNKLMPEEINRILTDHASDMLFAPTQVALDNLAREGLAGEHVHFVGDVMYDAARFYAEKASKESRVLDELDLAPLSYTLATIHRQENTDSPERLSAIFHGLMHLAEEMTVVLPLHPRTRRSLDRAGLLDEVQRHLRVIPPVGYLDMVLLEQQARLIATDSGGVQKEAFFYRVPCLTLRNETEWVELVELGWNHLVAPQNSRTIVEAAHRVFTTPPGREASPYGDGHGAERIASILCEYRR